ncbi:tellurium resistance protein [Malaciobacter molluscorum LMG 25693]|uniref:Tellurite resistance protein TehB n=1 Tax=Malaciobacter molluscorum LMG 25693 TaxID=870501 RepID=A0A2G1DEK6_9BACT|nr:class I SAM-dependent methyltransferase [Malaciobacter molluscorum]AXX91192.1 putative tellurite resistance protein TehB [Malaciobacter molluscorum LMG 25693]PHO16929.1 tellurium resistance protein [Malaciobacter molluscorum LMG 25693]
MTQQEFWNKKFSKKGFLYGEDANSFLKANENLLKNSKDLLFLGEGEGRNAIYFALNEAFNIESIDASNIGLEKLQNRANTLGMNNISTTCLDLNEWAPTKKYDAILFSYLHMHNKHRDLLFEKIEDSLHKNGYLIAEVFSKKQINYSSGGPKDLTLLYEESDFLNRFNNSKKIKVSEEIVNLQEGNGHQGKACVIRVIIQKK